MFERFTDRARRATVTAQEIARMTGSPIIATDHFIAALGCETVGGVAFEVIGKKWLLTDETLIAVAKKHWEGPEGTPPGHIPFSPEAKKILELALREALQLGHPYIGTEHILLALVRAWKDGNLESKRLFAALRMTDPEQARADVIEQLSGYEPKPTPSDKARNAGREYNEQRSQLIEQLRDAIDDLWGMIPSHLISELNAKTVEIARKNHVYLHHGEDANG